MSMVNLILNNYALKHVIIKLMIFSSKHILPMAISEVFVRFSTNIDGCGRGHGFFLNLLFLVF